MEGTWVRYVATAGKPGRWHCVRRLYPAGELAMYCGTVAMRDRVSIAAATLADVSGRFCTSCGTLISRAEAGRRGEAPDQQRPASTGAVAAPAWVPRSEEWVRFGSRHARGRPGPWHRIEMREGRTLRMWCGFSSSESVLVETRQERPDGTAAACPRCVRAEGPRLAVARPR